MRPEDIFGIVDEAMDNMELRNPRRPKPKPALKRARPSAIPPMRVKTSTDGAPKGVEFANVVKVPKNVLSLMASNVERDTDKLNKLFLQQLLPLLLSFDTSTSYARAALKEGLNIEIDFDEGLRDCVDFVGYLNIVMHFIKGSRLPLSVKKRFVNKFSDKLAEQAVMKLIETNKAQTHQQQMRELQAVVYERGKKKMTTHTKNDEEPASDLKRGRLETSTHESPAAIRRKRK